MTKLLKTHAGYEEFTVEEMLKEYSKVIYQFAHNCYSNLKNVEGNINTLEDYAQIGRIEASSAFKNYDPEQGILFSTYLITVLRYVYVHMVRDLNVQKRKNEGGFIYLNKSADGNDREDNNARIDINKKDVYFKEERKAALEEFLKSKLSEEELVFLLMDMKKQLGKSTGCQRDALEYSIDFLTERVNIKVTTKKELAIILGITRPTLNSRIELAVEKVRKVTEEFLRTNEYFI